MSKPNLTAFLGGALNPPARSKFRACDSEALAEVLAEDVALEPKPREPVIWPTPRFEVDPDREHWSKDLPPILPDEDLEAIPLRYEVWVLDRKGRSEIRSMHRVGPMKYFGIKRPNFPTEDQLRIADEQSRLCAQRAGYEYLLEGARRVDIRSYRRKEAKSRRIPQAGETNWVATMKSFTDPPWILGEPTDEALEQDAAYGT
jgi:hypothetical protein